MTEQILKLQETLDKLNSKTSRIFLLTMDTKGLQKASIAYNYELVNTLIGLGYNAYIMHEKNDYMSVESWLGSELSSVPHVSIESKQINVQLSDLVIVPEIFGHVLEQIKNMPCEKMILCQSYDYILETLPPGTTWPVFGVHRVITTTKGQSEMIKSLMPTVDVSEIQLYIPSYFKPSSKPQSPIISIHTRDQRDTMKIIKTFYLKFPQYKWISFRDLRNMSRESFAESLSDSCVSVWVDDISGFGTFPLESMMCEVPVVGKVPNLQPEWMTETNGVWTYEFNKVVDVLGSYINKWLEDEIPQELYDSMSKTVEVYSKETFVSSVENTFNSIFERKIRETRINLEKLTPVGVENE